MIIEYAQALAIYFACLVCPGYALCVIAGINADRAVWAFAFSLAILVATQAVYLLFGGGVIRWWSMFFSLSACVMFFGWFLGAKCKSPEKASIPRWGWGERVGLVLLICGFSFYHIMVGPYTEIPSDFWSHLGEVVEKKADIGAGNSLGGDAFLRVLMNYGYVHFLHAIVAETLNVHPLTIVDSATLATSLIFISFYYAVSLRVSQELNLHGLWQIMAAVFAVILMILSFGVASFSYIRYYAYFPHILGMSLVFGCVLLMTHYQEKETVGLGYLSGLLFMCILLWLINRQEALFAVILIFGMGMVGSLRYLITPKCEKTDAGRAKKAHLFLLALFTVLCVAVIWHPAPTSDWGSPHVLDLGPTLSTDRQILVINPSMRALDAIAPFGLFLGLLYLFFFRQLSGSNYLLFAMISPFLTVLNPVFVAWFIEVVSWDPLWRLVLLVPTPIVGAIVLMKIWSKAWTRKSTTSLMGGTIITGLMVCLLMPWDGMVFENRNSRLPSLESVEEKNGHKLWADLVAAVDGISGNRRLITDSVTGYVLTSATMHRQDGLGKADWQYDRSLLLGDYQDRLLYYGADGSIIIFNQRDGFPSSNGEKSGHWREDILAVSEKYPRAFAGFLTDPENFSRIWSSESVSVYEILRNPGDH